MISYYSLQPEVSTAQFDGAIGVIEQWTNSSLDGDSGFNTSEAPSPEMLGGDPEPLSDFSKVFISMLYAIVTVVAVGGNVIVCCIVATQRRMQTVTNFFIASLACSDALMASLCIPLSFVTNVIIDYWPFGAVMCPVTQYAQAVAVFLSAFTMLAISLDRYRAVIFPLRPRLTPRLAAAVIAVTWFLAMATSLPVAIFSRIVMRPDRLGVPRAMCLEEWPGGTSQQRTYSMAVMVLQYFLPLAILLFTYINIGVVIWTKKAPGEAESTRDQRLAASKRKMVKMMITVVVIYALCWLPLHTITLVSDTHQEIWRFRYIQWIWTACHWLAMSNCCYNPIVYCWMNAKFRAGFRHIFRCCPFICPDNSNSASSQMTSYTDAYSAAGGRRRYYSSATVSCSVVMTTGFDEHEQKSPFVTRKQIGGSLTSAAGRASVGHSPTGDCYALCRVEE